MEQKSIPRKTHWLFVIAIIVISFITAAGILCWQGSIIVRGQQEARQQALAVQNQICQAHQTKNSQWLTYTNYQYGFDIQHPAQAKILEDDLPDDQSNVTILLSAIKQEVGWSGYSVEINILDNPNNLSSNQWVDQEIEASDRRETGKLDFADRQEITIGRDQVPATKLSNVFAYDQSQEKIYISHDKSIIVFSFAVAEPNPNIVDPIKNNAIAHQIVDSFRFITDTSDWRTYKNERHGFEIKYPNDFKIEQESSQETDHYVNLTPTEGATYIQILAGHDSWKLPLEFRYMVSINSVSIDWSDIEKPIDQGGKYSIEQEQLIINGNQWERAIVRQPPDENSMMLIRYYIQHNGLFVILDHSLGSDLTTIDQMIATFKFTK